MKIIEKIAELKKQKNAVIMAHNYQPPEIQQIADILGDSLDLARKAATVEQDLIIFCGVDFMADTAKIIAPHKTVLVPRTDATCPMANMITAEQLRALKSQYPDAAVIAYVNSTAEVKALTDVCCTSANAVSVVNSVSSDQIIFVPDKNLGSYCQRFTDKELILWEGCCNVHDRFSYEEVKAAKQKMADALLLVHPECKPEIVDLADEVLSTSGMIKTAKKSSSKEFLIATEEGMIYRLQKEVPEKKFYSAGSPKVCINMKKTDLNDVLNVLENENNRIEIDQDIARQAKKALDAMLQYAWS